MGLRERAIVEYEKSLEEEKKNQEKERKRAIQEGIDTLKESFGDDIKIDVSDANDDIIFIVDDLKMKVMRSQGYYNLVYLIQTCPKCGTEYMEDVPRLKDLGKVLKVGHKSYECERALEAKNVKVPTTEERFIEAFKDMITEYSNVG